MDEKLHKTEPQSPSKMNFLEFWVKYVYYYPSQLLHGEKESRGIISTVLGAFFKLQPKL